MRNATNRLFFGGGGGGGGRVEGVKSFEREKTDWLLLAMCSVGEY